MKNKIKDLKHEVLNLPRGDFNNLALRIFEFQYELNPIYREFVSNLNLNLKKIQVWNEIPCMPISFYKSHDVILNSLKSTVKFLSSGTSGQIRSVKFVPDVAFYEEISKIGFEAKFGSLSEFCLFALLPSYIENPESSLIHMVKSFEKHSIKGFGGFYKNEFEKLYQDLLEAKKANVRIMLWGVSFALLDFVNQLNPDLKDILIFETGGMKGRKKEITREELHFQIRNKSNANLIYSEYGMTELLSQAYSDGHTHFSCPEWMKLNIMELNDPMAPEKKGRIGSMNIIDLASIETCSFLATEDLGRVYDDDSFEVLGRKDMAEIRGCNLLLA